MWPPRVLRTANFRLALSYAAVFSLSVFLLGVIVFFGVRSSLEQQLRGQIEAEVGQLLVDYRDDGLEELHHDIRERIESNPARRLHYYLQSPEGRVVFDPLPAIPTPDGWHTVRVPALGTNDAKTTVLLQALTLDGGFKLAVAADLAPIQDAARAIRQAFGWAFLFTLVAGAAGGLWIGQRFLSQVDAITRAAERIGGGDVTGRLPTRGTGDDLDQLTTVINRMLDRIQRLLENVRQVSTSIAHELRTPLGHLRQTLEALRVEAPHDTLRNEALRQLDATLDTFSALLRIAEVESGSRKAGFELLCLSEVLETVADAYSPVAEDNGQRLTHQIASGLYVRGDRNLLTQLFANLVENAVRYSGRGSEIHLALESVADGALAATVSDTGPGIPSAEHARVFEPFYRLDANRTGPGSGLGLSLVAAIASLHDLTVTLADNHPGLKVRLQGRCQLPPLEADTARGP
ncbi:sensor histidine kinase [Archangium lansingense]|uniref:histidine kinase n=1 Tax=Archangium lansingense TaxID=2995310 RepID=A0ABT3ZVU7_9BACT|nr:HAMP domain-containing sensor histidine kinase [Archangium lansinium]MCY1073528.1 HAMP domain-containing sensor histidine kinase [Archangium lansinium]